MTNKDLKGKSKATTIEEIKEDSLSDEELIEEISSSRLSKEVAKIDASYNDNNGESSLTKNDSSSQDISIKNNDLLARVSSEISKSFNEEVEKRKITPKLFREEIIQDFELSVAFGVNKGQSVYLTDLPIQNLLKSEPVNFLNYTNFTPS
jgi:hypothetical protein